MPLIQFYLADIIMDVPQFSHNHKMPLSVLSLMILSALAHQKSDAATAGLSENVLPEITVHVAKISTSAQKKKELGD